MTSFARLAKDETTPFIGELRAEFLANSIASLSNVTREVQPTLEDTVQKQVDSQFATRFSFRRFVVSRQNEEAYELALEISRGKGSHGHLIFLYGSVGCGKTHLIQAISNSIHAENPNLVIQISAVHEVKEDFIQATRAARPGQFIEKYADLDYLMVDDIQFLKGAVELQLGIFSVFSLIMDNGGSVILTSDRAPHRLEGLERRLMKLLRSGKTVLVQYPSYEGRARVLMNMAEEKGWILPDEVFFSIAQKLTGNIRELKGGLQKVVMYAKMQKQVPSPDLVDKVLDPV